MANDTVFDGPVPELYDRHLGPLLFLPFADDLARRAQALEAQRILETACGTGIVTAKLRSALPGAHITATDLNDGMLAVARRNLGTADVSFATVNAQQLPFPDAAFDLVVTQFGIMFFPDRPLAYREARRVLSPGGTWLFNVWASLDENPLSDVVQDVVAAAFPNDPPQFIKRTPFGHADPAPILAALHEAGFADVTHEKVHQQSPYATTLEDGIAGLLLGSPIRMEIEERDPARLDAIIDASVAEAKRRFGGGDDWKKTCAIVYTAR